MPRLVRFNSVLHEARTRRARMARILRLWQQRKRVPRPWRNGHEFRPEVVDAQIRAARRELELYDRVIEFIESIVTDNHI